MSLHNLAQQIQSQGRGNDTQLLHVTPQEINAMQELARAHGGSLTVNPKTGLPEAGFLDSILPTIIGVGASIFAPEVSPLLIGGLTGAATGAITGDLSKGLMAGLGAYGGSSLAGGLMSAGAAADAAIPAGTNIAGQTANGVGANAWSSDASIAANAAKQGANYIPAEGALSGASSGTAPPMSATDKLGAGFNQMSKDPMAFLKQNMLPIGAALAPMLTGGLGGSNAAQSQAQAQQPSLIRPYTYSATQNPNYTGAGTRVFDQSYTAGTPVNASDWGSRPIYMASGGIAALANGGNALAGTPAMGGQNNMYPMSQMDHTQYATPTQQPTSTEVIDSGYEEKTNPYTGDEVRMADGGTTPLTVSNRYSTPVNTPSQAVTDYNNLLAQRAQQEYVQQPALNAMVPQQLRQTASPQYQTPNLNPAAAPAATPDQYASLQAQLAALQQQQQQQQQPQQQNYGSDGAANGGLMQSYAMGGIANLGGYSDGGHLLKGPGDGVSDDIPATISGKQPARLADGEFVVPARIVSELGNGSTDAGAKRLYQMMERVQANRGKTVGKGKVAVDSKASKFLPA